MPVKTAWPAFRAGKPKESKPNALRQADGFYHYPCIDCRAAVPFRRRQRHPERLRCAACVTAAYARFLEAS